MKARLTLSLGGTCPAPPNTRRGTIEKPIAAAPVCPMNLRRETKPPGRARAQSGFFTAPPTPTSQVPYDLVAAVRTLRWFTTLWTSPPPPPRCHPEAIRQG